MPRVEPRFHPFPVLLRTLHPSLLYCSQTHFSSSFSIFHLVHSGTDYISVFVRPEKVLLSPTGTTRRCSSLNRQRRAHASLEHRRLASPPIPFQPPCSMLSITPPPNGLVSAHSPHRCAAFLQPSCHPPVFNPFPRSLGDWSGALARLLTPCVCSIALCPPPSTHPPRVSSSLYTLEHGLIRPCSSRRRISRHPPPPPPPLPSPLSPSSSFP